jgi:putative ABC transport system permease protein
VTWIALKMLTGDRPKYLAIIFGVTFASLLIAEQAAVYCGVMQRATGQIWDTQEADTWMMNPNVRYLDDTKPISDNELYRVLGFEGVAWAREPLRWPGTGSA